MGEQWNAIQLSGSLDGWAGVWLWEIFRQSRPQFRIIQRFNSKGFLAALGMEKTQFCDVALPVPLDMAFTCRIAGQQPVIGGRVLVPFRDDRMSGIVDGAARQPAERKDQRRSIEARPTCLDGSTLYRG